MVYTRISEGHAATAPCRVPWVSAAVVLQHAVVVPCLASPPLAETNRGLLYKAPELPYMVKGRYADFDWNLYIPSCFWRSPLASKLAALASLHAFISARRSLSPLSARSNTL